MVIYEYIMYSISLYAIKDRKMDLPFRLYNRGAGGCLTYIIENNVVQVVKQWPSGT